MMRALRACYGIYAAAMFIIVVLLLFCPLLVLAPTWQLRRAIGRVTVRAWLLSIGVRLRVRGLMRLPAGPCIVVCNHASYVDGIVLTSALPMRFTFLVQHGAGAWPYIGTILRRMSVRFVNRQRPRPAAHATLGLIRAARSGTSLAIFPEGSFRKEPGLQPFFNGAFFIGAKTGLPIVPAVIRGSRRLLGDGARWPAWSSLHVEILDPLTAGGGSTVDSLRKEAFRVMENRLDEFERYRGEPSNGPVAGQGAVTVTI